MRVLIDYRPALTKRTGVGEYVHRLVEALTANGDKETPLSITLFSSSWKNRLEKKDLDHVKIFDKRIPVKLLNFLWHRLRWPPIESLTGQNFDVVHSLHPLLLPARKAAQIVTIHDLDFLDHPEYSDSEIRRDYPALIKSHVKQADRIIVNSHYTAQEVSRRLKLPIEKITLCPPGAPNWSPRSSLTKGKYVLFLGTLGPRKNIGVLLRAYADLLATRQDIPDLVLAGKATPHASTWLTTLTQPPFSEKVRYLGYVPENKLQNLYEEAAVLVLPSLEEGFGIPALEAMTVGVPVVASNRGSLPEVLGDSGLLIDPENETALSEAIYKMIFDRSFAQISVNNGFQKARDYTWVASAQALRQAYLEATVARKQR